MVSIFPEDAIAHSLKKTVLEGCDICVEHVDQESVHIKEGAKLHLVELVEHFLNELEQSVELRAFSWSSFHRMGWIFVLKIKLLESDFHYKPNITEISPIRA
jgi:hypothetical protein